MSEEWFPPEVDPDSAKGNWFNVKKLKAGEPHQIRILSSAIAGYVRWGKLPDAKPGDKNKPFRRRREESYPNGVVWDDMSEEAQFLAFALWDYGKSRISVAEITQRTIQSAIRELTQRKAWGSPKGYDLTIVRNEGEKVSYSVLPEPPAPLDVEIADEWNRLIESGFHLEAMFKGGNPFPQGWTPGGSNEPTAAPLPPPDDDIPF